MVELVENEISSALRFALAFCTGLFLIGIFVHFCRYARDLFLSVFFSVVLLAVLALQGNDCDGVDYEDEI